MGDREKIGDLKKYILHLLSTDKPFKEIDEEIKNPNLASLLRRRILEEKHGITLSATGSSILDFAELEGVQSYKPIGAIQIPVTVIGPLNIDGILVREEKYIPLASIYPQLMKAIETGVKILESSRIKVSYNYCWLRVFSINNGRRSICSELEELYGNRGIRILCLGGSGGRIINTVIIGENPPCSIIREILSSEESRSYIKGISSENPILAPYLVVETRVSTGIPRSRIEKLDIGISSLLETYNTLEDIKSIDNSLHPILLSSIASLYYALGIKPEYGLRSEIKGFALYSRFRKVIVYAQPRIVTPIEITSREMSQMNKELSSLLGLTGERIDPMIICELGSVVGLASYIGLLGEIASSLPQ